MTIYLLIRIRGYILHSSDINNHYFLNSTPIIFKKIAGFARTSSCKQAKIAEEKIRAEYARGELTASVKDAIDRGMDKPRKPKDAKKLEDTQS